MTTHNDVPRVPASAHEAMLRILAAANMEGPVPPMATYSASATTIEGRFDLDQLAAALDRHTRTATADAFESVAAELIALGEKRYPTTNWRKLQIQLGSLVDDLRKNSIRIRGNTTSED